MPTLCKYGFHSSRIRENYIMMKYKFQAEVSKSKPVSELLSNYDKANEIYKNTYNFAIGVLSEIQKKCPVCIEGASECAKSKMIEYLCSVGLFKLDFESTPTSIALPIIQKLIGSRVRKKSNKPFKSGQIFGNITGIGINAQCPKKSLAFIVDDSSYVNMDKCKVLKPFKAFAYLASKGYNKS